MKKGIVSGFENLEMFWPPFVKVGGSIFLSQEVKHAKGKPERQSVSDFESFINHVHILDMLENDVSWSDFRFKKNGNGYDQKHPHFKLACEIGKILIFVWGSKLILDFPKTIFRVYYAEEDNPVIRFHRVWPNEFPWLDEKNVMSQIEKGKIIILETKNGKLQEKGA